MKPLAVIIVILFSGCFLHPDPEPEKRDHVIDIAECKPGLGQKWICFTDSVGEQDTTKN